MKKYLVFIYVFFIGSNVLSQSTDSLENDQTRKLTKEQKLEKRKAETEATALMVDQMINARKFVLQADFISDQTGNRLIVSSQLNFIKIDSSVIDIQIARGIRLGANGLGGITADGTCTKWIMKRAGKNKQLYSIDIAVRVTRAGYYDIFMNINPDGSAQATLSGTDAAKIIFYGKVVSLENSRIYKGSSI